MNESLDLTLMNSCNIIIKNGAKQFVGLYYDNERFDAPIVLFKRAWHFDYILEKYAQKCGVACVEDKLLANALFDAVAEGKYIPDTLFSPITKLYSKLSKYKNAQTENYFQNRLDKETFDQIFRLESVIYKSTAKKCLKQSAGEQKVFNGDASNYFKEELFSIAKSNGLDCRHVHNNVLPLEEFYLEAFIKEQNFTSWQMAFVNTQEREIYIAARAVYEIFDFSQVENALNFVKALAKTANGRLKRCKNIYHNEFKISPRVYEIASVSIKTMLEINRAQHEIEYEYNDGDYKTYAVIHLSPREKTQTDKKFEIVITYSEFMRNPTAFKNFIAAPHKKYKWNFWCHERAYKKERLDEKFRQEEKEYFCGHRAK